MSERPLEARRGVLTVPPLSVAFAQLVPRVHHLRLKLDGPGEHGLGLLGVDGHHVVGSAAMVQRQGARRQRG